MVTKVKKQQKVLKPINFAIEKQRLSFANLINEVDIDINSIARETLSAYDEAAYIKNLLFGTGETLYSRGNVKLYETHDVDTIEIQKNLVTLKDGYPEEQKNDTALSFAYGVLVKMPKKGRQKLCIVANGDINQHDETSELSTKITLAIWP